MLRSLLCSLTLALCLGITSTPSLARNSKRKARRKSSKRKALVCRWNKRRGKPSKVCRHFARKKQPDERFLVIVGKTRRKSRLYFCRGARLLRSYRTGHGRRGFGKQKEGDKKTPVGSYKISWMAARHEPKRDGKTERKLQRFQIRNGRAYCKHDKKTNVSRFRRDRGPREERLWRRPYGGKFATVMAINYPNKKDQKAGRTGSCIEIHASFHRRSSAGCVLLLPSHIRQIYNCLKPGTRVEIRKRLPKALK